MTSLDAGGANVSLTAGGAGNLTQTGALLNVGTLSATAGGAVALTNFGNTIASLAASTAGSGMQVYDANGMSVSGIVLTVTGDLTLRAVGDLTLNAGGRLQADAGNVVASTEGAGTFLNYAGNTALVVGSGDRWLVYSATPDLVGTTHTLKGGLTSNFRAYNATYGSYAPGIVTQTGNGFIYAYATPTLTVSAGIIGTPSQVYGSAPATAWAYAITGVCGQRRQCQQRHRRRHGCLQHGALQHDECRHLPHHLYAGGLTSSNVNLVSSNVAL